MSEVSEQAEKAEQFRKLHRGKDVLLLPNAWDVPSARVFEDAGFRAVATSSAGMMVSLGYPDGESMPFDEFIAAVRRVAKVLAVPMSADVVSGFGDTTEGVVKSVSKVVEVGAVGINVEDFEHETKKLRPLEKQLARLRALVKLRDSGRVRFVVNARTDAFRFAEGDGEAKFREAVRRGEAFRDAGVDCVYPMGLVEEELIARYVRLLSFPVNVMVRKGLPPVPDLRRAGVARLSFGPSASYAAMGLLKRASSEVMERGTYGILTDGAITFDELNDLAVARKRVRQ